MRKTRDKNGKEKNTGQKWYIEKYVTKKVEINTGKNGKEKNAGQKW